MPRVSVTGRLRSVFNDSNFGSGIPVIRARSNFTGTSHSIRSSSRSAIPTGVWALSAGWFTTAARIGRAVLLTAPFTAGRPTPEKSKSESSIPAEAINPAGILFYY